TRCSRVSVSASASVVSGDAVCTCGVILLRTSIQDPREEVSAAADWDPRKLVGGEGQGQGNRRRKVCWRRSGSRAHERIRATSGRTDDTPVSRYSAPETERLLASAPLSSTADV